jgi:predicted RNA binding protein YcfA (HicA-like mRNA interferase family)
MSQWSSSKAAKVFAALLRIGWRVKRQSGSHKTLSRDGWPNFVFAFHDGEKLVRACSRGSPSTPASHRKTCEHAGHAV